MLLPPLLVALLAAAPPLVAATPLAPEPHSLVPGALGAQFAEEADLPQGTLPSVLAPSWSADYYGGFIPGSGGRYHYDGANQRNRQAFTANSTIFGPKNVAYFDSLSFNTGGKYNTNMTVGRGKDSVCKPMLMKYVDPFVWLKAAKPNGTKVLDGERCTVYRLAMSFRGKTAEFSACIAADGVPRELNESLSTGGFGGPIYYRFTNAQVGQQDPSIFQVSDACARRYPTAPCHRGRVRQIDLYRVHGATEPVSLENRDLGDASGDMAFFCAFNAYKSMNSSLVTHWRVKVNTSFSQYSYCLFRGGRNTCSGGEYGSKGIGRESALGSGQGRLQGQCSPNRDVGSWYSFPTEGHCPPGKPVGTAGCTWADAEPVRTVTAACILRDRGLQQSCAKEFGHPPFRRSIAIFEAALASSDTTRGGCPDAPSTEETVLV